MCFNTSLLFLHFLSKTWRYLRPLSRRTLTLLCSWLASLISCVKCLAAYHWSVSNAGKWNFSGVFNRTSISYTLQLDTTLN